MAAIAKGDFIEGSHFFASHAMLRSDALLLDCDYADPAIPEIMQFIDSSLTAHPVLGAFLAIMQHSAYCLQQSLIAHLHAYPFPARGLRIQA